MAYKKGEILKKGLLHVYEKNMRRAAIRDIIIFIALIIAITMIIYLISNGCRN